MQLHATCGVGLCPHVPLTNKHALKRSRPAAHALYSPKIYRLSTRLSLQVVCVARPTNGYVPPQQGQRGSRSSSVLAPAFLSLGVDPACLPGLVKMGITEPSQIQRNAVQQIISGANVAIQSFTGSGKTLAYLLPAITLALKRAEATAKAKGGEVSVQALIVAPNQELAMQIVRVAQSVLPEAARRMVQQCIGAANINNQQLALERNRPIIIVGTPGRLAQLMRMGMLRIHRTPLLVLDEADQLLAPHFTEDMFSITTQTGKRLAEDAAREAARRGADPGDAPSADEAGGAEAVEEDGAHNRGIEIAVGRGPAPEEQQSTRQTVMASATLTETVLAKTAAWCPSPVYTTAGPALTLDPSGAPQAKPSTPEWGWGLKGWDGPASSATGPRTTGSAGGVEQAELVPAMPPQLAHMYIVASGESRKADTLRRAVHALDLKRVLVFMNFQQRLKDFQYKLQASKMKVATLHGELNKVQRVNILNDFRRDRLRALMVSDLVARGLDVPECDAVFNAELPSSAAHYAHRAGRTGRMGAPGSVITIVTPSDAWVVDKLAKRLGVPIQEMHVANGELRQGPAPHTDSQDAAPSKASSRSKDRASSSPSPNPDNRPSSSSSSNSYSSPGVSSSSSKASLIEAPSRQQQPASPRQSSGRRAESNATRSSRSQLGTGTRSLSPEEVGSKAAGGFEEIYDDEDEFDDDGSTDEEEESGRASGAVPSSSRVHGNGEAGEQGGTGPSKKSRSTERRGRWSKSRSGSRAERRAQMFGHRRRGEASGSADQEGVSLLRQESGGDDNASTGSMNQDRNGRERLVPSGVGSEGQDRSKVSKERLVASGGSSKVKEDLIRELAALREEKVLAGDWAKRKGGKLSKK